MKNKRRSVRGGRELRRAVQERKFIGMNEYLFKIACRVMLGRVYLLPVRSMRQTQGRGQRARRGLKGRVKNLSKTLSFVRLHNCEPNQRRTKKNMK